MRRLLAYSLCVFLSLITFFTRAQNKPGKELTIKPASGLIKLDGRLDEADWQAAETATEFYLNYPVDTIAATFQSEVKVTFDKHFLYFGIVCYDDTKPDVKAVEYFLKKKFESMNLGYLKEFIHFGLTSQDINNTAIPLSIKDFMHREYYHVLDDLVRDLNLFSKEWKDVTMLARTHGQPASPTKLGKEIAVFSTRIEKQVQLLRIIPYSAKFGGATGNFNAHHIAYPEVEWNRFADEFCQHLGLVRSFPTTQIEHYDNLAALFDNLKRINTIFIDLCRDIWHYISLNYFKQKIKEGEVGSSAMPHKVNPIDFENAEGNLGFANAIFEYLAAKLPISRLQRDLTDSTVLRNVGVPLAHTYVAFKSITRGLSKLELNRQVIEQDLEENWAVIAEAIQTVLRKEGYPNPYEALKALTRNNQKITQASLAEFIDSLKIKQEVKNKLKEITPFNYTGI